MPCPAQVAKFSLHESQCHTSLTSYCIYCSSRHKTGGNIRMIDWGCWVDRVALYNQISWWIPESLKLCAALYCHVAASFMLDSWSRKCLKSFLSLSMSWHRCHSCMSPLLASHPQESLLYTIRRQQAWPWRLTKTVRLFSSHKISTDAISWIAFCLRLIQCIQVSSAVTIWNKKVSPLALKFANNSEEMA